MPTRDEFDPFHYLGEVLATSTEIQTKILHGLMLRGEFDPRRMRLLLQDAHHNATKRSGLEDNGAAEYLASLRRQLFGENESRYQALASQIRRQRRRVYRAQHADFARRF
jgi:hypothetical protein